MEEASSDSSHDFVDADEQSEDPQEVNVADVNRNANKPKDRVIGKKTEITKQNSKDASKQIADKFQKKSRPVCTETCNGYHRSLHDEKDDMTENTEDAGECLAQLASSHADNRLNDAEIKSINDYDDGMVIIVMDDGKRLKRRTNSEIVVPLDSCISSECVESSSTTDLGPYAKNSSDLSSKNSKEFSAFEGNGEEDEDEVLGKDLYDAVDLAKIVQNYARYDERQRHKNAVKKTKWDEEVTESEDLPSFTSSYKSDALEYEDDESCKTDFSSTVSEIDEEEDYDDLDEVGDTEDNIVDVDAENVEYNDENDSITSSERPDSSANELSHAEKINNEIINSSLIQLIQRIRKTGDDPEKMFTIDLTRQILRLKPNFPLTRKNIIRMLRSLSADGTFQNMSQSAARTKSSHLIPTAVGNSPPVGDTAEIHQAEQRQSNDLETPPFENNPSTSPVCSTRFDFTPGVPSKAEGTLTACSGSISRGRRTNELTGGVTSTDRRSQESGRENPQAKEDGEVRRTKKTGENVLSWRAEYTTLTGNLPPIARGTKLVKKDPFLKSFLATPARQIQRVPPKIAPKFATKTPTVESNLTEKMPSCSPKPVLPHQLKSLARYHDNQVDVSLNGDQRFRPDSRPVNVNTCISINQNKTVSQTKAMDSATFVDQKSLNPVNRNSAFVKPQNSALSRKSLATIEAAGAKLGSRKCSKQNPLPPITTAANRGFQFFSPQEQNLSKPARSDNSFVKNKTEPQRSLPPLRNAPRTFIKRMKSNVTHMPFGICRKFPISTKQRQSSFKVFSPLKWDVINDRAQWPPFNTHVNPEASARYQRLFADS